MRYAQVVPILAPVPPVDMQASDASLLGLIALASQVMARPYFIYIMCYL